MGPGSDEHDEMVHVSQHLLTLGHRFSLTGKLSEVLGIRTGQDNVTPDNEADGVSAIAFGDGRSAHLVVLTSP